MKLRPPIQRKKHRYQWIIDLMAVEPSFFQRSMFGCVACYLRGRLVLVLAARERNPWRGLLVPTDRAHHRSLRRDFVFLRVHSILGKWLYLPESVEDFEQAALGIVDRILAHDSRFGVESSRSS